jgi:hypothetical protein
MTSMDRCELDYRWHLRQVMAARGMFATTDLLAPLSQRGITLASSQVYRLVTDRPERLSLKILLAVRRAGSELLPRSGKFCVLAGDLPGMGNSPVRIVRGGR